MIKLFTVVEWWQFNAIDIMTINKKKSAGTKTNKNNKPRKSPPAHDALVKKALENPVTAQEFLDEYLPDKFKAYIDLSSLTIEKESYVEDSLKKRLSDIVYKVNTKDNRQAFIYCLCEHQSTSDYRIAFRLWHYSLLLLERHNKGKDKLPIILPLVIYNGKGKYTAPRNLWDLFDNPLLAREIMTGDYNLIDLYSMRDDEINYEKHLSFLLYVLKHIHDRDLINMLQEAMNKCYKAILIDKGKDYIHTKLILWYTDSKVPIEKARELEQLITDNLPREDTENIMKTIADAYIQQGEAKGIEKGIEKGMAKALENTAIKMLKAGLDFKLISSVTSLSIADLIKLKNKL